MAEEAELEALRLVRISPEPLDLGQHLENVSGPGFGAVVTFIGQIRDHDPDASGQVERLEYEAHPDAEAILTRIVAEVEADGIRVAVSHRTGSVEVGEPALIACVASAHRDQAYEASRELIERIKAEVPIWKRQVVTEGTHNWQGLR